MEQTNKKQRGGYREGSGRKHSTAGLTKMLSVRITPEAYTMLDRMTGAKGEFVDRLIREEYTSRGL